MVMDMGKPLGIFLALCICVAVVRPLHSADFEFALIYQPPAPGYVGYYFFNGTCRVAVGLISEQAVPLTPQQQKQIQDLLAPLPRHNGHKYGMDLSVAFEINGTVTYFQDEFQSERSDIYRAIIAIVNAEISPANTFPSRKN